MSKKRDCYDIFSGSRDEKELIDFVNKPLVEQWKELFNYAKLEQPLFLETLINIGVENSY